MKESTRKVINYLRPYIGQKVIRTEPLEGEKTGIL